jgi:hypothetical protein
VASVTARPYLVAVAVALDAGRKLLMTDSGTQREETAA